MERPALVSELSQEFGAQAVVLAVDAKRSDDYWEVMIRGGGESASLEAIEWVRKGVQLGAREILLTSIDRDGTKSGFDSPLTAAISRSVSVPVIAPAEPGCRNTLWKSSAKARRMRLSRLPSFTTVCNPFES